MTKIVYRLNLGNYDVDQLFQLYALKIITANEVVEELRARGLDEYRIVQMVRAAG